MAILDQFKDDPEVLSYLGIPSQSQQQVDAWNSPAPTGYNPAFANDPEVLSFAGVPTQAPAQVDAWNQGNPRPLTPVLPPSTPDARIPLVPGADKLLQKTQQIGADSQQAADDAALAAQAEDLRVRNEAFQKRKGELDAQREAKETELINKQQDREVVRMLEQDVANEVDPKVDPARFTSNMSSLAKGSALIAGFLHGFLGKPGSAGIAGILGQQIEQDIAAQRDDIANGQTGRKNRLQVLRDKGMDMEQAENRLRIEQADLYKQIAENEAKGLDQQSQNVYLPAIQAELKAKRDQALDGYVTAQRATRPPPVKAKTTDQLVKDQNWQDFQTARRADPTLTYEGWQAKNKANEAGLVEGAKAPFKEKSAQETEKDKARATRAVTSRELADEAAELDRLGAFSITSPGSAWDRQELLARAERFKEKARIYNRGRFSDLSNQPGDKAQEDVAEQNIPSMFESAASTRSKLEAWKADAAADARKAGEKGEESAPESTSDQWNKKHGAKKGK